MGLGYGESWEEAARTGALGRSLDLLGRSGGELFGHGKHLLWTSFVQLLRCYFEVVRRHVYHALVC